MAPQEAPRPTKGMHRQSGGSLTAEVEFGEDQIIDELVWIRLQIHSQTAEIVAVKRQDAFEETLLECPVHPRHVQRNCIDKMSAPKAIFPQTIRKRGRQVLVGIEHPCETGGTCCGIGLTRLTEEYDAI